MWGNKLFYRVDEDGYCTCCHQEGAHDEDCPVVIWANEEKTNTDKRHPTEEPT